MANDTPVRPGLLRPEAQGKFSQGVMGIPPIADADSRPKIITVVYERLRRGQDGAGHRADTGMHIGT